MRSLSCGGKHLYLCGIRSPQLGPQATSLGLRFPNSPISGPAFSTTSLQGPDDVQSQALQESVTAALSAWPVHQIANFHSPDISPPLTTPAESTTSEIQRSGSEAKTSKALDPRLPRSVQAIYLKPLKRRPKYGLPACDLQLRSYSVRNLEFFTDFALRAAYYLYLPAAGPVPLPRMKERWTVPRSPFIHNSSQENFERITLRRLIQIQDGNTETVEIWLAFLRKHAYYGIGMKANVWGYEKLGVGKTMDVSLEDLKSGLEPRWANFGIRKNPETSKKVFEMMSRNEIRQTSDGPMKAQDKNKPLG